MINAQLINNISLSAIVTQSFLRVYGSIDPRRLKTSPFKIINLCKILHSIVSQNYLGVCDDVFNFESKNSIERTIYFDKGALKNLGLELAINKKLKPAQISFFRLLEIVTFPDSQCILKLISCISHDTKVNDCLFGCLRERFIASVGANVDLGYTFCLAHTMNDGGIPSLRGFYNAHPTAIDARGIVKNIIDGIYDQITNRLAINLHCQALYNQELYHLLHRALDNEAFKTLYNITPNVQQNTSSRYLVNESDVDAKKKRKAQAENASCSQHSKRPRLNDNPSGQWPSCELSDPVCSQMSSDAILPPPPRLSTSSIDIDDCADIGIGVNEAVNNNLSFPCLEQEQALSLTKS